MQITYILTESSNRVAPSTQKIEGHNDYRQSEQQIFTSVWAKSEHSINLTRKFRKADPSSVRASCLTWESKWDGTGTQKSVPISVQICINRKSKRSRTFKLRRSPFPRSRKKLKRVRVQEQKPPSYPIYHPLFGVRGLGSLFQRLPLPLPCFK